MTEYSVEEVRKAAAWLHQWERKSGARNARGMITAYADLLEQIERAREGVTEEVVEIAAERHMRVRGIGMYSPWQTMTEETRIDYRAAMRASLQSVAHLLPSGDPENKAAKLHMAVGELLWVWTEVWPLVHSLTSCETVKFRFKQLPAIIDKLTARPPAQVAQADTTPHCVGHDSFEYDCIDCSDAGERLRTTNAEPVAQVEAVACDETHPTNRSLFKFMCTHAGIVLGEDTIVSATEKFMAKVHPAAPMSVPNARALHVLKAAPDEPQFDPEDFTSVDTRLYFWRTGWNACRDAMLAAAPSPGEPS